MQFKPQPRSYWNAMRAEPDFLYGSDIEKRLMTWSHLEYQRLKRLGWPYRHTRIWVLRNELSNPPLPVLRSEGRPSVYPELEDVPVTTVSVTANSLAPWYTLCTPKCGYFFCQDRDNRRKKPVTQNCDLPKWRPNLYGPLRQSHVPAKGSFRPKKTAYSE